MLIIYILIPLILLRSCQSGSSSKSPNCTETPRSAIGRFFSALATFVNLLCFLDGMWNTIRGFIYEANALTK
ncbi:unnamed protein product [Schistosoma spindalis]|nr:unnamed protein product [Schistosoma spindale]